jgi:hypothetical protein
MKQPIFQYLEVTSIEMIEMLIKTLERSIGNFGEG